MDKCSSYLLGALGHPNYNIVFRIDTKFKNSVGVVLDVCL